MLLYNQTLPDIDLKLLDDTLKNILGKKTCTTKWNLIILCVKDIFWKPQKFLTIAGIKIKFFTKSSVTSALFFGKKASALKFWIHQESRTMFI